MFTSLQAATHTPRPVTRRTHVHATTLSCNTQTLHKRPKPWKPNSKLHPDQPYTHILVPKNPAHRLHLPMPPGLNNSAKSLIDKS